MRIEKTGCLCNEKTGLAISKQARERETMLTEKRDNIRDFAIRHDAIADHFFFIGFMWASEWLFGTPLYGMVLILVLRTAGSWVEIKHSRHKAKMAALSKISSYNIFRNTTLYSNTAFLLGGMLFTCYITFSDFRAPHQPYPFMLVWMAFVTIVFTLFAVLLRRHGLGLRVGTFLTGATIWIVGSVMLFRVSDLFGLAVHTTFWALGIASTTAVMKQMDKDFRLVTMLADKKMSEEEVRHNDELIHSAAIIMADTITLLIVVAWFFLIEGHQRSEVPRLFKNIMIQLPVLFMLAGMVSALKQPLDERSREKLQDFYAGYIRNDRTRENLRKMFIHKYRTRIGIKILIWFLKPFFRMKVEGKENLDKRDYPAIFVSNHGVWSGPMAAVMYLPTYFRPWVHNVMLDRRMAAEEMYSTFFHRLKIFGEKMQRRLAHLVAGPVTWALNAFNPIPVERSSHRRLLTTFHETIEALAESDNVLIFPERPMEIINENAEEFLHNKEQLRDLATGFASIGKLYYAKSGRRIAFYPMYINRQQRVFRIGRPIIYNPHNNYHEEKQRISEQLKVAIDMLSTEPERQRSLERKRSRSTTKRT